MTHLVVIGAGIAGLVAACAAAPYVEQVTLVDRDSLPDSPVPRSGVAQSHHSHLLTRAGSDALEKLVPGIEETLLLRGAQPFDWGNSVLNSVRGRFATFDGLVTIACSRALLEQVLYQHIQTFPNISVLERTRINEIIVRNDAVVGIQAGTELLPCDMVVVAAGASAPVSEWLGISPIVKKTIIKLSYATRTYSGKWDRNIVVVPEPLGVASYQIEDEQVIVTLATTGLDNAIPTDEDEFQAFAEKLAPEVVALRKLKAVSAIRGFRREECQWRQYHKCHLPSGVLVMGDAVSTFNPVFGQGMSVAILSSLALKKHFDAGSIQLSKVQREIAKIIAPVWQLTTHSQPDKVSVVNRLLGAAQEKAVSDASVAQRLIEVLQLIRPPTALLTPPILWQMAKELSM